MNVAPDVQQQLLHLQALDSTLSQHAHRRAHLPQIDTLAGLADEGERLEAQAVDLRTERSDVSRQAAKLEQDVEQVRNRASRDQQRLDSGAVGSAKELEGLQHEIGSLARRQTELEDLELEVLQRLEDLDAQLSRATALADDIHNRREATLRSKESAEAEIDEVSTRTSAERATVAAALPEELLVFYERLREQLGGVAVTELRQRRCDGCRLELNATEVNRFRDAPPDALLRCEDCRRIVVRTDRSGL